MPEQYKQVIMYVMEEIETIHDPFHYLFVAILDRALRDVLLPDQQIKRETLQWFRVWKNDLPDGISYKDICDHIGLSAGRKERIEKLIESL